MSAARVGARPAAQAAAAILALWLALPGCTARAPDARRRAGAIAPGRAVESPPTPEPASASTPAPGAGFRSRDRLEEHFAKHGAEFGGITIEQYLARARRLRDAPRGGAIEELQRDNGDVARFDRGSGEFGVYETDGTIRTFFRPRDGEAYFRRQARRHDD